MKLTQAIRPIATALLLAACSISAPNLAPTEPLASSLPSPASSSGRLVFIAFGQSGQNLVELELASGDLRTLFDPPANAWLNGAAVSPDGTQVVLAYAPPPSEGEIPRGYTDLYIAPIDQVDRLQPVLARIGETESYFNPIWSPDGRYIYYSHLCSITPDTGVCTSQDTEQYTYTIERIPYPPDGSQPERLIEHALWPRLSSNGKKIAYISVDLDADTSELYVADADGTNATRLLPSNAFVAVDAPLFTSDGETVIFSAVDYSPSPSLSLLDQLLGVQVASAHSVPSDWWHISITGGKPERLTELSEIGLYGALSPDGMRVAFISADGVYVMNLDGSELTQLLTIRAGSLLDWIP